MGITTSNNEIIRKEHLRGKPFEDLEFDLEAEFSIDSYIHGDIVL